MSLKLKDILLENSKAFCIAEKGSWRCYEITDSHHSVRKASIGFSCSTLERVKNEVFIPRWGQPDITDVTIGRSCPE